MYVKNSKAFFGGCNGGNSFRDGGLRAAMHCVSTAVAANIITTNTVFPSDAMHCVSTAGAANHSKT